MSNQLPPRMFNGFDQTVSVDPVVVYGPQNTPEMIIDGTKAPKSEFSWLPLALMFVVGAGLYWLTKEEDGPAVPLG